MKTITRTSGNPLIGFLATFLFAFGARAYEPPGDPPPCSDICDDCPSTDALGYSALSLTEGNLKDDYHVVATKSAFGSTMDFLLSYNSFNADGSHSQLDIGLGYGWTHSYNSFLFNQRGHMFLMDGKGRITKFKLDAGGKFLTQTGYFENLVSNPDGSFTLTEKNQTVLDFALVPNTPFMVGGPVYRLIKITDRNGNITAITYTAGLLTEISDTYGRKIILAYDSKKKLSSISDPIGRQTKLTYDSTGRKLARITDAGGKFRTFTYNTKYQMIGKTDRDGRTFTYQYASGLPVAMLDGAGAKRWTLSNPLNWATDTTAHDVYLLRLFIPSTTTVKDGRGNTWKYDYNAEGHIVRKIAPDGATTRYTYDPGTLKVASMTDPNGNTTTYKYDALGNRIKKTDALGNVFTFTYEPVFSQMTSMTDPKGRITHYEYDADGNRIKETDPLGQFREWTYDSHGNVLTGKDKRGFVTSYEYDAFGNRIKGTDPLGNVTQMAYDALGNILSRTDANNHVTQFQYDVRYRLIKQTDPLGAITLMAYDGEGNQVSVTDRNGHKTTFQYDLRKRLIKTTDALGQVSSQAYDGNDNRISMTDKNTHTTAFAYDLQNRLTKTIDALGNIRLDTLDPAGNVLSSTDPNGHTAFFAYDALNRRVAITDAVGGVTQFEYDEGGQGGCASCGATPGSRLLTKETDGNGKVTYFKYDELDRLIKIVRKEGDTGDVIDASDAVTVFVLDPSNNRLAITEPNGDTDNFEYDSLNRPTRETNAAGDLTSFAYDGVGNLVTTVSPNGNVTTYTSDARDRLIQMDDSIGRIMSCTYDPGGNRLSQTDGNANTTTFGYDAIDRLIKVTDPLGETTVTQYDSVGNVIKTIDRNGKATAHLYDDINRRTQTTDALGHNAQVQFDAVGNRVKITDANGHVIQYAYDGVNQLIQETYPDAPPNTRAFTYDAVGNRLTRTDQKGQVTTYAYNDLYFMLKRSYPLSPSDDFTYDLSGRLLTANRGGWPVTFAYDGADRLIQSTQNGQTISYAYNIPGKTRTVTYPGGRTIIEQTDFRSRLSEIADAGAPPPIVKYTYDLGNRVGTRTYRNGTVATYTFNANDWILSVEHAFGGTRIAGFAYDFDKVGNKKFEEKRHQPLDSEAYQYDGIYRLIDYKIGALVGSTVPVPLTQTAYNLDPVGNWNSKTVDAVTETRTHNEVNEIVAIDANPLGYDDNGNLTQDTTYTYSYDEENRLTQVTRDFDAAIVAKYRYDALGRRVIKLAEPAGALLETRYFYDDARIIEERDASNATQATYVYGNYVDEVLTMIRGAHTFFYHQNSLWSVEALTDNTGTPVERYAYDAYGRVTVLTGLGSPIALNAWGTPHSAIGNPYLFTGRQLDEETGLYEYRARYYDSAKGRFLSRDPMLDASNDPIGRLGAVMIAIEESNIRYLLGNLYAFVANNPLRMLDPFGLDPKDEGAKKLAAAADALKALCKKCCKCEPCTPEKCEAEAQKITDAIVKKWNDNYGNGRNDSSDNVGGYLCWDWSEAFESAGNSVKPDCWTIKEAMARKGKTRVVHYFIELNACNNPAAECTVIIDDGWFPKGEFVHNPPYPPDPWKRGDEKSKRRTLPRMK